MTTTGKSAMEQLRAHLEQLPQVRVTFGGAEDLWPSSLVRDKVLAVVDDAIQREKGSPAELLEALKACSFRLATVVAAYGSFDDANARALDQAIAAIANAERVR